MTPSTALKARGHRHLVLDVADIGWCDDASLYTVLGVKSALQHADGASS